LRQTVLLVTGEEWRLVSKAKYTVHVPVMRKHCTASVCRMCG
jgi:hypothetical protein